MNKINEIRLKAAKLRRSVLEMDYKTGGGHIGGAMSEADILATLFFGVMNHSPEMFKENNPARDRFVLSKGHTSDAYYATLALAGYIPESELDTYCAEGSRLAGHPTNKVFGIEVNTGALGHGLGVSVGMAKAAKMDGLFSKVFCIMGDGEQAEGSVWEAAMSAAHYGLENLTAIVDRNGLQIAGSTEDIMALGDLVGKYRAFGWEVFEADGHDIAALFELLSSENTSGKPRCVVAKTIKGKGVSYMEGVAKWHHGTPSDDEYSLAVSELNAEIVAVAQICGVDEALQPAVLKPAKTASSGPKYIPARQAIVEMLTEKAKEDSRIVTLTSDARGSASLGGFIKEHPEKFVEIGIAEQNEVGVAAGLALSGKVPFVFAPACFLSARSYEQVKVSMAYSHTNVKLIGVSGGASYAELGQTHHSLQDIAAMRSLPGLVVSIPADAISAKALAAQSVSRNEPMYMRVGRAATADVYTTQQAEKLEFGKAFTLREGADVCIISSGVMTLNAVKAAEILTEQGVEATIIDMHTLKPLDTEAVFAAAKKFGKLVTVEEHVAAGGLGSMVCETLASAPVPVEIIAFPDENAICGSAAEIYKHAGLDAESIAKRVLEFIR